MNDFLSHRIVALIPARGGSKSLPRKNLLKIGNLSLLERAIDCGTRCRYVNQVVVSTEDEEIAEEALKAGADVHHRHVSAAADSATAEDVVFDFAKGLERKGLVNSTLIVYLQPTSPFRDADHVSAALELVTQHESLRCVSVVEERHSPLKSLKIDESGLVQPIFDRNSVTANRQSLPRIVRPNGAIYIFTLQDFVDFAMIPISGSVPYEMDFFSSVDIDSKWDVKLANYLLTKGNT